MPFAWLNRPKNKNPQALRLAGLGPLYHSYKLFGVHNEQKPNFVINQRCKEPILRAYIQYAIAKCTDQEGDPVTFAELFCADGYFAMIASLLGATKIYGYDDNSQGHFDVAPQIAAELGLTNIEFITADVNNMETFAPVDIVANIGGLYHVSNPIEILEKSYALARRYLIVQTVTNLEMRDDPDYYESPAPGWTWGNRFSQASFDKLIKSYGWEIIDEHFNELRSLTEPQHRGGSFYLIKKKLTNPISERL